MSERIKTNPDVNTAAESLLEIAAVDPMLLGGVLTGQQIKAGTMAVVPHIEMDDEGVETERSGILPAGTIVCAGQTLDRSLYPKLSSIYHGTGTFYEFILPDLTNKFIIGVNEDGEYVMGDGIIYYDDIPNLDPPSRPPLLG